MKDWIAQGKHQGMIRVYGTPAEEGGAGKVYMVREGLFKDVDVVLHWHASDRNDAIEDLWRCDWTSREGPFPDLIPGTPAQRTKNVVERHDIHDLVGCRDADDVAAKRELPRQRSAR